MKGSERLRIQQFTFNPFAENTYVVSVGTEAVVVDPGMATAAEWYAFESYLEKEGLQLQAVWLTHAHIDHILGLAKLREEWRLPLAAHPGVEAVAKASRPLLDLWGMPNVPVAPPERPLRHGARLRLGMWEFEVRETPGHSPDHVVFYEPQRRMLLGGDVLFKGSIGRTDLPGGDYGVLMNSIMNQLMPLPDDTVVWTGHGPSTTIGDERRTNPFILEFEGHAF